MQPAADNATARLTASILSGPQDLESLRDTWAMLEADSPLTPWQQWNFVSIWWNRIGSQTREEVQRELRIVIVQDAGRPRLLLPLQLARYGRLGVRWLEPLGMPDDIHRPRVGIGELRADLYACALDALQSIRHQWDGLRVDEKAADDEELLLLRKLAAGLRWTARESPLHACPTLALSMGWPEYLASRSQKLRKNLSSSRRRLQSLGAVTLCSYETPEQIEQGFEVLLQVTARSWKAGAKIGLGSSDHYRQFYREYVRRMAAEGRVRAHALFCGERPVAATLAFISGTTYYSTHIAHDAGFDPCSPGTLLESMEMEALLTARQFKTFDFLGAALSNKRRWTDTMDETLRVMWLRGSLRGLLFDTLYFRVKPLLRRLRNR